MAEQKIDPSRPKDDPDAGSTGFQPLATPSVDKQGHELPLGPETLEAQRKGMAAAEKAASGVKENPLAVSGVEADGVKAKVAGADSVAVDKHVEDTKVAVNKDVEKAKHPNETAKRTAAQTRVGGKQDVGQPNDESRHA